MTNAELQHQITLAAELLREWNREAEARRVGRLGQLDEAYHNCNQAHARLNYLEGLQKVRTLFGGEQ